MRDHMTPSAGAKSATTLKPAEPRPGGKPSGCAACAVRNLTVCAPLDGGELLAIGQLSTHLTLACGDPLFAEGDPAAHVFNVTEGTLKVFKLLPDGRRQVTGFLSTGDFLGLANGETYAYSAEAVTAARLCRFQRRKLDGFLAEHPEMERRLLHRASNELAEAQEQMLLLGRKTAKERIASFLLLLSRRAEQRGGTGDPVFLPMSRTDIADYLGLTTETVSRTFTRLKTEGVIQLLPNSLVRLARREALAEIAEAL